MHRLNVLNEHTLNRYIALYTEQRDSHCFYTEQFARWQRGKFNESQNHEVNRLIAQSLTLKATIEPILALVEKLAPHTVDSLMAMDDELTLMALTRDRMVSTWIKALLNQSVLDTAIAQTGYAGCSASRLAFAISLSRRF